MNRVRTKLHINPCTYILLLAGIFSFTQTSLYGQTLTQRIRGSIQDQDTGLPVGDAIVQLKENPDQAVLSDSSGRFVLEQVSLGHHSLVISKQGYKTHIEPDLLVSSGKQIQLKIELEMSPASLEGVEISASRYAKEKPLNDFSLASSRMISVEETLRYPGSANDPARMVQSFAGIQAGELGANEIVIRGNSSRGLLWRIEGVEAYNPNHFSFEGTSFGGISIMTNTALANSDFATGAFQAEYGNALSGVFDLRLRNGNTSTREFTLQAGTLGLEAAMEGPFSPEYKGSYLLNLRYSTLSLFESLGMVPVAPAWQDAVMKLNLPAGRAGDFSVYAIGGLGNSPIEAERDSTVWREGKAEQFGQDFRTGVGIFGIRHRIHFGKAYLRTSLTANLSSVRFRQDSLSNSLEPIERQRSSFRNTALRFNTVYNLRLSARKTVRAGLSVYNLRYNFRARSIDPDGPGRPLHLLNDRGNTNQYQGFITWKIKPVEKLEVVAGLHAQYFGLSDQFLPEPRAALSWQLSPSGTVSAAYGNHSRIEPLSVYFSRAERSPGELYQPNTNLDPTRAHHYVLGYDHLFSGNLRLKAEAYYQHLYQVPVAFGDDGTFSVLNMSGYNDVRYALYNQGKGRNYGLDITFEKFLTQGSYFLLTGSLFRSLFTDIQEREHATAYDRRFSVNLIYGKEWQVGRSQDNLLQVSGKLMASGARRFTPIDLEASVDAGHTVYDTNRMFAQKDVPYFRADLRINYQKNKPSSNWSVGVDIINLAGREYVLNETYDETIQQIYRTRDVGIMPNLFYRWEF